MREVWRKVWRTQKYANPKERRAIANFKIQCFQTVSNNRKSFTRVVDAGCGGGYFSNALLQTGIAKIEAFDFTPEALAIALRENASPSIIFSEADVTSPWPITEGVEAVYLVGVIEHVKNAKSVLSNAHHVLSPRGFLFLCSSNRNSLYHLQKTVLEFLGIWRLGYQQDYTFRELQGLVSDSGFKVISGSIFGCAQQRSILGFFDRLLYRVFGLGRYIVLIAERSE